MIKARLYEAQYEPGSFNNKDCGGRMLAAVRNLRQAPSVSPALNVMVHEPTWVDGQLSVKLDVVVHDYANAQRDVLQFVRQFESWY